MISRKSVLRFAIVLAALAGAAIPHAAMAADVPKPGVSAVQRPMAGLKPLAVLKIGKTADWVSIVAGSVIALSAGAFAWACPPDSVPARPAGDVVIKTPVGDVSRAALAAQDRRLAAAVSDKYRKSQVGQPTNAYFLADS